MEFRRQITAEKVRKAIEFTLNVTFINPAESPAVLTKIASKSSSPLDFSFKWNLRSAAIILSGSAAAIFLILIALYFLFDRFSRRRRSEAAAPPNEDFLIEIGDEPYHIWYIKTAGLDQPTIEAISVIPFKKSESKAHVSDCAVCLGEFQEEEMLRLLPKCNHAFHVSCIDTWLRSHVNCPICRSLIADPAQNPNLSNLEHNEGESEDIEPIPPAESEIEDQENEIAKEAIENQESEVMDRPTSMDSAPR